MYSKDEKVIMWLSSFDFMSYKKARFIIDNYDNLSEFFDNIPLYKTDLLKVFDNNEYNELLDNNNLVYIEE